MKEIQLTNRNVSVQVSDEDYEFLTSLCTWSDYGKGYARSSRLFAGKHVQMHRLVAIRAGLDIEGKHVHHRDENSYNNKRDNLEPKTASQHVKDHNETRVWATGEAHGNTRIADVDLLEVIEQVMSIGGTQRDMQALLEISIAHIGDIVHGRKRPDLKPKIDSLIAKYNWRRGNQSNTDDETLEIVKAYFSSGLSYQRFADSTDGKISRQHLQNVVSGKRLPHLQEKIAELK